MPSAFSKDTKTAYDNLNEYFTDVKVLPSLDDILKNKDFKTQLKDISVEDLLARHPADLDKNQISSFIYNKTILITGAGGSIGSEIVRQCINFKAKKLIILDHSEFNLYQIEQETSLYDIEVIPVMQNIVNKNDLEKTFLLYNPNIVIHAAAYKHVPLVEQNIDEAIINNIVGSKNVIDLSIKHNVDKVIMISTDKAVRPTNVMGTTKRICELYAQNSNANSTDIVAVRFGNVLGSSGSVIPKFKSQIQQGKNITVTHKDITRYFMLIPEACELVLQAGAIGKGGEILYLIWVSQLK
jgi:FlaA1/EpsC-like NDP-sugar epimerase